MSDFLTSVVTCVQNAPGLQGPCPSGFAQVVQNVMLIPASEAHALEFLFTPFDTGRAAAIFGFVISTTLGIWFVSRCVGTVVRMVR